MEYSLIGLNETIDRWIKIKYFNAINKDYVTEHIKNLCADYAKFYSKSFYNEFNLIGNQVYHLYCFGKYKDIQIFFSNDMCLVSSISNVKKNKLIKDKAIEKVKQDSKQIKKNIKDIEKENVYKTEFVDLSAYKIIDEKLRVYIFYYNKLYVFTREVLRKVEDNLQLQQILNIASKEEIPLTKGLPPKEDKILKKVSKTSLLINEEFENIKNECFNSDDDYHSFLELLVNFFEYKPVNIPQETIKLKRRCKTKIASIFNPIHKNLSEKTLISDIEYFNIIKVLNHFSTLSNQNIYKLITR